MSGCFWVEKSQPKIQYYAAKLITLTGSVSSGVREGAAEVFDVFAQRTLRDIEQNGYYVRVPAGKEFYVYVLEGVNPEKAKIVGAAIESGVIHHRATQPADTSAAPAVPSGETKG